jgi:hypothetical protein
LAQALDHLGCELVAGVGQLVERQGGMVRVGHLVVQAVGQQDRDPGLAGTVHVRHRAAVQAVLSRRFVDGGITTARRLDVVGVLVGSDGAPVVLVPVDEVVDGHERHRPSEPVGVTTDHEQRHLAAAGEPGDVDPLGVHGPFVEGEVDGVDHVLHRQVRAVGVGVLEGPPEVRVDGGPSVVLGPSRQGDAVALGVVEAPRVHDDQQRMAGSGGRKPHGRLLGPGQAGRDPHVAGLEHLLLPLLDALLGGEVLGGDELDRGERLVDPRAGFSAAASGPVSAAASPSGSGPGAGGTSSSAGSVTSSWVTVGAASSSGQAASARATTHNTAASVVRGDQRRWRSSGRGSSMAAPRWVGSVSAAVRAKRDRATEPGARRQQTQFPKSS